MEVVPGISIDDNIELFAHFSYDETANRSVSELNHRFPIPFFQPLSAH